ncbi:MAG: dienelactone hydrolase family protein [Proteobacteria bacterium]|nr:dienelactone hydrolase family protein [Pseudomonadota bacterium]
MTGQTITVSATDGGEFSAYVALPKGPPGPGIIMFHEIFGVTNWIKESADMFAEQGYCVAAPEMYWRLEPNFIADHNDPEQREKGLKYRGALNHDLAIDDIASMITKLKTMPECNGKIGVVGFCLGGTLAYLSAARLEIDAAVAYYGTQIHEFLDEGKNIKCQTVFHMGKNDDHVPEELLNKIHAALIGIPNIAIYLYDAGHAFSNTHRPDYYLKEASRKAHSRTFDVFDGLR